MADRAKLLVIGGPTATGKTSLSVALAKHLHGEILCADSMQIYEGLVVGTAQATPEEMEGIPHHLVGFLSPAEQFSVAAYVKMAQECIRDMTARGKLPIVVGGTGLYIQSLVEGIAFVHQPTDMALRARLQQQAEEQGMQELYAQLQQVDPVYAATLHPNNRNRVLRALELYSQTGLTMSQQLARSRPAQRPYCDVCVALQYADRETLYAHINTRVDTMMAKGLLEEAQRVWQQKDVWKTASQAIGYKEFFPYFSEDASLDACVDKLKQASRNYAKRQITWFSRMPQMQWMAAGTLECIPQIEALLAATS